MTALTVESWDGMLCNTNEDRNMMPAMLSDWMYSDSIDVLLCISGMVTESLESQVILIHMPSICWYRVGPDWSHPSPHCNLCEGQNPVLVNQLGNTGGHLGCHLLRGYRFSTPIALCLRQRVRAVKLGGWAVGVMLVSGPTCASTATDTQKHT